MCHCYNNAARLSSFYQRGMDAMRFTAISMSRTLICGQTKCVCSFAFVQQCSKCCRDSNLVICDQPVEDYPQPLILNGTIVAGDGFFCELLDECACCTSPRLRSRVLTLARRFPLVRCFGARQAFTAIDPRADYVLPLRRVAQYPFAAMSDRVHCAFRCCACETISESPCMDANRTGQAGEDLDCWQGMQPCEAL